MLMDTLLQDLRYGVRMLAHSPGFAAAAILALALGIGANTAIFSVVNAVLLRPLPYPDPDTLFAVGVVWTREPDDLSSLADDDVVALRAVTALGGRDTGAGVGPDDGGPAGLAGIAAYYAPAGGFSLTGRGEPLQVYGTQATWELFEVLGARPMIGRVFEPADDHPGAVPVVVLSHALWQSRFGADRAIVGTSLTVDGVPHTVAGVMPPGFRFPRDGAADLWASMRVQESEARPPYYLRVVARMDAGASPAALTAALAVADRRIRERFPDAAGDWTLRAVPLKTRLVGDAGPALVMLLVAVALVLLIATANIANLLLARATARRREMAIRAALGAARARLARQLITESLVLAGAGGLLGAVLALWGIDVLVALGPRNLPRLNEVGVDRGVLLYTALVTLASGLLFGLAPALQIARARLAATLQGSALGATDHEGRRLRNALVIGEFALAVMLLCGAGLLIRSLQRLQDVSPGVETRNILTASITLPSARYDDDAKRVAFFRRLVEDAERLPGVEAASVSMALPPDLLVMTNPYVVEGRPPRPGESPPAVPQLMISPGYFRALGVPLLRGRGFTEADGPDAPKVMIINEAMARQVFPGEDPVGRKIQTGDYSPGDSWTTIVGVVGDVRYSGLDRGPEPTMYTPHAQDPWWPTMYLAVRSPREAQVVLREVRGAIAAIDPDIPLARIGTMHDLLGRSVAEPRFRTLLLGLFAAVALALAVVGIYGLIAYDVGRRTREIGIRMALGARRADVLALVLRQGMALAGIGIGLGLLGAFALCQALAGILFGVSPADPPSFAAATLAMCAVALAGCWLPARQAARVDPMVAMRTE
jgi:putative ABC transport system permease protein